MEKCFLTTKFELLDSAEEILNTNFKKVKLYIQSDGDNYNGSSFEINSMREAMKTIDYIPILAYTVNNGDEYDFDGHNVSYDVHIDSNGETTIRETYEEVPIGVVTKRDSHIENVDGKNFIVAYGYIWESYSNKGIEILERDEEKSVSMEISVFDGHFRDDGIYNITKYEINGVTVLGQNVLPAIEGSKIQMSFSAGENKQYETAVNNLKKLLENFNRKEEKLVEENKNFEVEEVIETPNEVDKQEFSEEVVEEVIEEFAEGKKEEETCPECGKNPCECEEKEEEFAEEKEEVCPECGKEPCECEENKEEEPQEEKKYTQSEVDEMIANTRNEFATVLEELACLREFKAEYDRNVALKQLNDEMDALLVNFNVDENIVNELREKVIAEEITLEKFELELYRNNKVVAKKEEFNKKALPISDAKEHKMSEIDMLFARYGINKK